MNTNITQVWKCSDGETFTDRRAADRHQLLCDAVNEIHSQAGVPFEEGRKIMTRPNAVIRILQDYLDAVAAHHAEAST